MTVAQKDINRWVAANIISAEQGKLIAELESTQPRRSWIMFGIVAVGLTALITGLISIVASNWDQIGWQVKLAGYFVLLTATTTGAIHYFDKQPSTTREGFLVALSALTLAGIGLIAQTFHLQGDGWGAMLLWIVLTLPIIWIAANQLSMHLWLIGFGLFAGFWLSRYHALFEDNPLSLGLAIIAFGYLLLAARWHSAGQPNNHLTIIPPRLALAGGTWSWAVIVLCSPLGDVAWNNNPILEKAEPWLIPALFALGLAAFAAAWIGRRDAIQQQDRGRGDPFLGTSRIALILSSVVLFVIPIVTPHPESQIAGCVFFIALWASIAAIAASMERKRLFDLATFVIAVRLIVVYFQVFGSMAASGVGLIISGSVILGAAFGWNRLRRTLYPATAQQA